MFELTIHHINMNLGGVTGKYQIDAACPKKYAHVSWFGVVLYNSYCRDRFVYAPSQLETTLQGNVVSQWLGAYTKWFLVLILIIQGYFSGTGSILIMSHWAIGNEIALKLLVIQIKYGLPYCVSCPSMSLLFACFYYEVNTAFSLLLPTKQGYKYTF